MDLDLFARSALIGLSIAAPVGPIGMLCIRKTLAEGLVSGLACGLGAAAADAAYGFIAAQGLVSVASPVMQYHIWLRILGSCFLLYIAYGTAKSKPQQVTNTIITAQSSLKTFASTFCLTLTNPMTIFSFVAIFAALGVGTASSPQSSIALTVTAVLGVFAGSLLWWLVLTALVSKVRQFVADRLMVAINFASAAIIGAFAVAVLFEAAKK